MRRSAQVFAPLLAATAVALSSGCHQQPEPQRCVDEQNHVVDQKFCANLPPGAISSGAAMHSGYYGSNGIFIPHMYRSYYGGLGGYALGSIVSGGSYAPVPGHAYSPSSRAFSSSGTSRGGFGSSFSGGEGGGGE
jgi:hypothetical protein